MRDVQQVARQLYELDDTEMTHHWVVGPMEEEWRKIPWEYAPYQVRKHFHVQAAARVGVAGIRAMLAGRATPPRA